MISGRGLGYPHAMMCARFLHKENDSQESSLYRINRPLFDAVSRATAARSTGTGPPGRDAPRCRGGARLRSFFTS